MTTGGVVAVDPNMDEMLKQRCVLIQCVISHYITWMQFYQLGPGILTIWEMK